MWPSAPALSVPALRWFVLVRSLAVLVLALVLVLVAVAPTRAAADDFYTVPAKLARFKPGDVIKSEPVASLAPELDGTIATRIMYRSIDAQGRPVGVTGMLFTPAAGHPDGSGWPVVSFTHGTTGVGDACAPSKHPNLYWDVYAWLVGRLVRDGFVVVATDYEGLGTPGLHPWLELDSEARSAVHAVSAARQLVANTSTRWAVVGHSQGGHAAHATAELATSLQAKDLTFVGAVSLAPGSHLTDLAPLADAPDRGWDLLAYAAASIKASDASFDYSEMLVPPLLTEMPRAEVTCDIELFDHFAATYSGLSGLRADWLAQPRVAAWFARNEPGRRPSAAPILLLQGNKDEFVPEFVTRDLAARLCANGDTIDYRVFPGADHDRVIYRGYDDVVQWLRARFAGGPAGSTCP
jgi:acetyl esterase/lipase